MARKILGWLGVLALSASALMGSNIFSIRDRLLGSPLPEPVLPVTSRVAGGSTAAASVERTSLRSVPWWQAVETLEGTGPATSSQFTIDRRAIQWRVTWTCVGDHIVVRAPQLREPVVDAACPQGTGFANRTGVTSLEVSAGGPWRLEVAQRIDIPLVEPPLPAMTAPGTTTLSEGSFYNIDRIATGKVTIYSQADGGYSVRLDDFWVSPSSALQLRLSEARAPESSADYLAGGSQLLAALDVTAGSLNYPAPVGADPTQFQSVVVWNPSTSSAYGAASLTPAA